MQLKDVASSKRDLLYIHPSKIQEEPGFNARQDYGDLDQLAQDIAVNGVRVPLEIRLDGENIFLVDGHRRRRAALLAIESYGADIKGVPCQNEARGSTLGDRLLSQIIRNSGKPLEPFEEREVFKRLIDFGWTAADIAKKIGKPTVYVNGRLDLAGAVDEVKEGVEAGMISVGAAGNRQEGCREENPYPRHQDCAWEEGWASDANPNRIQDQKYPERKPIRQRLSRGAEMGAPSVNTTKQQIENRSKFIRVAVAERNKMVNAK